MTESPTFGTNCIQCLSCLQYCPKEAITLTEKSVKREHYHNPNVSAAELMESIIHID
ncbi:MAG: 4Fe-4S binding protein [Oscillospiraceae bacterium]